MQGSLSRLIDRDRVPAKRVLDHRRRDVIRFERIVSPQDLERFLERLLGQRVESEPVGPIEELPEKSADALGPGLRVGNPRPSVCWISSTLLTRISFQSKNSSLNRESAWLACSRVVSSWQIP